MEFFNSIEAARTIFILGIVNLTLALMIFFSATSGGSLVKMAVSG